MKTLEQFDFSFQPGIDRKVVRELAGLAFVERSENVILLGPPGVGKTHLAVALGEGRRCRASGAVHAAGQADSDADEGATGNRLERQLQQLSYRAC